GRSGGYRQRSGRGVGGNQKRVGSDNRTVGMSEEKLPKGWKKTVLGKVSSWSSGGTPSRGVSLYYNGIIPWIKTGDLNDGILTESSEFISEEGLKNSSAK